ncbi:hypothetical protein [Mycobacterium sp. SMC-4]|uniref:hypothetical protein n=1 Tax=Mycobacterium sp. SMC-4 TaxID=2857059 RepID=UPI0021B1DC2C|nr:hypothetical protein [Mycobacterium sp. SMC-4]UXA16095.1 hypothetical protein KXD98_14660 [Mycobacterium sp. SMC-4]
MALALSAHPEHISTSERSSAPPLHKRAVLTGVALVSASVLTITPMAPAPAALAAAQARDVQMAAWTNPLTTWQEAFKASSQNIAYGLNEVATKYPVWLGDVLRGSPTLFQELGGVFGNTTGWQALAADLPGYGDRIREAIQTSIADSQGRFDGVADLMRDVAGYLGAAQFNNAFAAVNEYFLWSLGAGAWPLFDVLAMPGQIAQTLGAGKLANVFDVLLTDNALGHYTESLLGPVVTAAFQFTEVLDDIAAAIKTGDWTTALSETINMPGKVVNALLNGYTPRLAIEDGKPWPWVGLLTPKGAFEQFFINMPRDIAWAMKVSREEFLAAKNNPAAATADVSSTDLAAEDRLVSIEVGLRGEERKLSQPISTDSLAVPQTPEPDGAPVGADAETESLPGPADDVADTSVGDEVGDTAADAADTSEPDATEPDKSESATDESGTGESGRAAARGDSSDASGNSSSRRGGGSSAGSDSGSSSRKARSSG